MNVTLSNTYRHRSVCVNAIPVYMTDIDNDILKLWQNPTCVFTLSLVSWTKLPHT